MKEATFETSIAYQCWFQSWLLCFWYSFLFMHVGRQQMMVQVLGFLPPTWSSRLLALGWPCCKPGDRRSFFFFLLLFELTKKIMKPWINYCVSVKCFKSVLRILIYKTQFSFIPKTNENVKELTINLFKMK